MGSFTQLIDDMKREAPVNAVEGLKLLVCLIEQYERGIASVVIEHLPSMIAHIQSVWWIDEITFQCIGTHLLREHGDCIGWWGVVLEQAPTP